MKIHHRLVFTLTQLFLCFLVTEASASFANYNSILIGEKAAGMGGAFTALSGDPAGCAFYNPATLARMEGSTLSAAVSVYNKFDTTFGKNESFGDAPLRVNQGAFVPIPASSGSVYTFRNFAFGLSIVIPDSEQYNGEINSSVGNISLLNLKDDSLWVGGSLGLNITERDAIGFTMYYTSRNYSRSVTDRVTSTNVTITNEEKTFTNNSVIYILGYYRELNRFWSLGLSQRFSSVEVSGKGTFFRSQVSTGGTESENTEFGILSETRIPAKTSFGLAYEEDKYFTFAIDLNYYDRESYLDLQSNQGGGDLIVHKPVWNISIGGEYYLKTWLGLRFGLYSNLASTPSIPDNVTQRTGDHLDMWGFSANAAVYTGTNSSFTFGGNYTGGRGHSTQLVNGSLIRVPKSQQIFTMLVGTTFRF